MPGSRGVKLRWGLLGVGDVMGKLVISPMKKAEEVELVAACRRDESRLRVFAEEHGIPRTYTDADSLVNDSEIDAVYVATPHNLHCRHAMKAAKAGKHVLVEKPMAVSAGECREMIRACAEAEVCLGVSYYRRTLRIVKEARRLLEEGAIGRPVLFRVFYPSGLIDFAPGHPRIWLTQKNAGGGSLFGVGSHAIDLLLYLGGDIAGVTGAVDRVVMQGDADDVAGMVCRFRSGALGMMSCSYNSPAGIFPVEISGTRGRISFDASPRDVLSLWRNGRVERIHVEAPGRDSADLELVRSFSRYALYGQSFAVPGEEAIRTNVVIDALFKAARSREWAAIDWNGETAC